MVGRKLAQRLVAENGIGGRSIRALTLVDVVKPDAPQGFSGSLVSRECDFSMPGEAQVLIDSRPDVIFHLAAIVSGEAEADFDKGYRINLDGTRHLFDAIRLAHQKDGYFPRVVFTSSIAVVGAPLPYPIPDEFHLTPLTSYGTQKAISELLLADYSRRGFLDGIGIRLPTVCIRPGKPNKAASGFFSSILREPLVGQEAILPVPEDVRHWHTSPRSAVGFLIHAATLDLSRLGWRRSLSMPGVSATVGEQIEALRRVAGDRAVRLIRREPDETIMKMVAGWAPGFEAKRATELGFTSETSFDEIIQAGYPVTAWNRDASKAQPLVDFGAAIASSPVEAVAAADIVFTMLTDGRAVGDVLFTGGVADAMKAGSVLVDTSSIAPDIAREHAALLEAKGVNHLDAPVSGGVVGAEAGTLAIMAGGEGDVVERLADVFAVLGRVTHVGPSGAGQVCKLANQQIVAVTIGAVAEAMVLVSAGGASREAFRNAIRGGFAESRILELHGARMVERKFEPGGSSKNQLKDLNAVMALAEELALKLPLTSAVRREYSDFVSAGSSRGLGRAIATGLGEAGASLIINGMDADRSERTASELRAVGLAATALAFDVADEASVTKAFAQLDEQGAVVDILVNNAGIQLRKPMVELTIAEWHKVLDTNLTSAFLVAREAAKRMLPRGRGKIINIGSLMSGLARPTVAPYTAAKGGIKLLTQSMTAEWGPHGIQTNAIGPGYMATDMNQALMDNKEFSDWVVGRTPARRWGDPGDLIGAAVFLSSAASDYVSGQIIYVDGGMTAVL
eukprot:g9885.t1